MRWWIWFLWEFFYFLLKNKWWLIMVLRLNKTVLVKLWLWLHFKIWWWSRSILKVNMTYKESFNFPRYHYVQQISGKLCQKKWEIMSELNYSQIFWIYLNVYTHIYSWIKFPSCLSLISIVPTTIFSLWRGCEFLPFLWTVIFSLLTCVHMEYEIYLN